MNSRIAWAGAVIGVRRVVAEGGWSHRLVRAPVADCGTGELMFWLGRVVIGVRRVVAEGGWSHRLVRALVADGGPGPGQ